MNWFVGGGSVRNSHSLLPQDHTFKSELGELRTNGVLFPRELLLPSPSAPYTGLTVALSTEMEEKGG